MTGLRLLKRVVCVVGLVAGFGGCADASAPAESSDVAPPLGSSSARRHREALVVAPGPDLRIVDVVSPVSAVVRNGTAQVAVTLCNAGAQAAPASRLDVLVSTDSVITSADTRVATDTVPTLSPGACVTRTLSGLFTVSSRSYLLGALADPLDALNEESESNNAFTGPSIYVGSRADLTISLTSAPPLAAPNTAFNVAAVVCNIGSSSASSTRAEVRLSLDSTIDTGDVRVGLASLGSVAAGACVPVTISSTGAATTERNLGLRATTSSTEVTALNNTAVGGLFAIGTGPDLVATLSATLTAGVLTSTATVCNQGTAAAPASTVRLVLSLDALVDASDVLVVDAPVAALAANTCAALTWNTTPSVAPGSWTLLGVVDPNAAVAELLEGNNGSAGPALSLGADLALTAMVATDAQTHFSFEATICNQGNLVAAATSFRLVASVDQSIGVEDSQLWTASTPSLAPADCAVLSGTFSPPALGAGDYFLIGQADDTSLVPETDEGNNVRVSPPVGLGADLVFEAVNAWMANAHVGYSVRLCNRGNVTTPPSNPAVVVPRLSADQVVDVGDAVLPSVVVPSIAPGTCFDVGSVETPSASGLQYFLVSVDDANQIVETNEANNVGVGPLLGISPDLSLQTLSASFTYPALTVTARVCNLGTMPSNAGVPVFVRLSLDQVYDATDATVPVGLSVGSVGPGACVDVTGSAPVSTPGTFWVLGRVDEFEFLPDLDRTNNTARAAQQVALSPDLSLQTLSASFTYPALTVTARVCNLGTLPSNAGVPVFVRLSLDQAYDVTDATVPMNLSVGSVGPGACVDVTGSASVSTPGTFWVLGRVDEFEFLPDLDRTNNTAMAPQPIVLGPNLALQTLGASLANQTLTVTAHVCNVGTLPSNGVPVFVRLSVDQVYDVSDLMVPVPLWVNTLAPGACVDFMGSAGVSTPGTFWVFGRIDEVQAQPDLNRDNNTAMAPQALVLGPDLALQTLGTSLANQTLTVTAHVCNVGTLPSNGVPVFVRLSVDQVYDVSDLMVPVPLWVNTLAPGACVDLMGSAGVSTPGTFWVFGRIDEVLAQPDLDRSNNTAMAPQPLALGPDLALQTLGASLANQTLTVTAHVCNVGTLPSNGVPVFVRLSVDQAYDVSDLMVPVPLWVNTLAPGACADLVASASVSTPGTFWVVGRIDEVQSQPDLDRSNDTAIGPQVVIP